MEAAVPGKIRVLDDYTLEILKEDHTLINPLKWVISNNWSTSRVEFCGYTIPHPSDSLVHLSIQFEDEERQNAANILDKTIEGLGCLQEFCDALESKLEVLNQG